MNSLCVDGRPVDPSSSTLVIAEIGVNHDGSLDRALELVQIAKQCGADAVKLQIFQADQLMHHSSAFAEYQEQQCVDQNPIDMLRRYELNPQAIQTLVNAIRAAGLLPLATPFSLNDVETIEQLNLPAIKIASPDLVNLPLLERAAKKGTSIIISTGASTLDEVHRSVAWLRKLNARFALLHCVSSYPTPADEAHLSWIGELAQFGVPVGYSDHTTEIACGALAVSAGACIIEKHLTYDRAAAGPDHAASADPKQFAEYVKLIRLAERMRGRGGKCVLPIERDVRSVSRQSLVLRRDLSANQSINETDLIVQRPGTGISAADISAAIGRRARHALKAGTLLQWDMLSDAA